jgi:hypothetical protein
MTILLKTIKDEAKLWAKAGTKHLSVVISRELFDFTDFISLYIVL